MAQREGIEIVVTERGSANVAKQISAIGDASEKSIVQTNRLKNALYSLGAATGALKLAQLVDQYTNLTNRLRTVTSSTDELRAVQRQLFDISNKNRTSIDATIQVYQRMSTSLKDVGFSTQKTIDFVDTLSRSVALSGASTAEAKGALIQFAQALGSNFKSSGQEINSLLEQLPIIIDAIAAKLGVTRGEIKKLAQDGKLNTKIVSEAVLEAGTKWNETFAKLAPTMGQAVTVIQNRFLEVVGAMDETTGASTAVAQIMLALANNMKTVVGVAATLATTLSLTLARYALDIVIGRMLDFLKLLVVGPIMSFVGGIRILSTALVAQGAAFGVATVAASKYLITLAASTLASVGRMAGAFTAAIASVRGFSLAAVASGLTIRSVLTGISALAIGLLNPFKLLTGAIFGLGTAATAAATGGVALLSRIFLGVFATLGGFIRLIGGAVAAVATIGVAMVTLGDQTTIAKGSLATYQDFALTAWEKIKSGFSSFVDFVSGNWGRVSKGAKEAFGESESSFLSFGRKAASGLDFLTAAFGAAYDTIIAQWRSFPAALVDLVIQGTKKAYQAVVDFMQAAYKFLKDAFSKLISLDFSGISAGGLDTQVEGAANRVGETFNDRLKARLEAGGSVVRAFEGLVKDSEAKASERIKKAEEEAKRLKDLQDQLNKPGVNRVKDDDDDKQKKKTFADYLQELEREKQLGLATGDAYKVLNEQIEIANKLRRDLTETEKGQVAEAVKANAELERRRALLSEIKGPQEEYGLQVQALTALFQGGHITLEEFNNRFAVLRENFLNGLPEATTFAEGFERQIERMQFATKNGFGQMGTEVAKIFGPGGTLINGIGDAIAQSIVFGKSFKEQIRGVAQSILSQLIGSLVKMGLNMALNAATGQASILSAGATTISTMGAIGASAAPAAAAVSLATGGANAAGASAGISTIFSLLAGLAGSLFGGGGGFKGFSEGGYTGAVGVKDVAGVVHGQEFVINAAATKRHRSLLEALNAGKDPGQVATQMGPAPQPVSVSITNEIPDAAYEVRPIGESEVEIIAKRVLRREAPDIIANDLRNPNSRTSKSLSSNTLAGRRR